jgi:hypothetical protein
MYGWCALLMLMMTAAGGYASDPDALSERARRLAHEVTIIDAHMDVPYRLWIGSG